MEYLMTYGWAILIIAVVLGALFSLGVFNGANFAPKAPPGACQVFRPNGPGTTSFINLEGVCNGMLPEYVAVFNGAGAVALALYSAPEVNPCTITLTAWSYESGVPADSGGGGIVGIQIYSDITSNAIAVRFEEGTSGAADDWFAQGNYANKWIFTAITLVSNTVRIGYINGVAYQDPSSNSIGCMHYLTPSQIAYPPPDAIGYWNSPAQYFSGDIANAQIYNTSLSSNEINALYLEGIGGAPIDLQNLVGWWPLNGNANDYSGNMNNGQATNVIYTSSWTSGYTPP